MRQANRNVITQAPAPTPRSVGVQAFGNAPTGRLLQSPKSSQPHVLVTLSRSTVRTQFRKRIAERRARTAMRTYASFLSSLYTKSYSGLKGSGQGQATRKVVSWSNDELFALSPMAGCWLAVPLHTSGSRSGETDDNHRQWSSPLSASCKKNTSVSDSLRCEEVYFACAGRDTRMPSRCAVGAQSVIRLR